MSNPDSPTDGPSLRVLVVDDNVDAADSLAALLEMIGHTPKVLYAGEPVPATCKEFAPDVVLLDIGLPGADGYAVARQLRANGERATLVALTGWGSDSDRRRAAEAGFDRHLTKPVDLGDLEAMLRDVPR
jgi:DNA-binding response OmpR family regulator